MLLVKAIVGCLLAIEVHMPFFFGFGFFAFVGARMLLDGDTVTPVHNPSHSGGLGQAVTLGTGGFE